MESRHASKIFEALSSDVRLDVFRLLVKNAPGGLVAGDIAKSLDLPATNLSFHLKALVQSGLVGVEREGRFLRYRASIPLMLDIIAYLTAECCSGNPECCRTFRRESGVNPRFLPPVAENACRSGENDEKDAPEATA
ncbi:ArsR/SmtB family transcription factor [Mailhella massiliensis]|uniref:ArsR/SmtB family transcription factor n=1 Tax=Mailhella massiliensis TaxID=1903261 RepID=UPI00097D03B6|nr:metalloregulator ArsR/SmtB family transcription factor [Mailhella massiliensis]